MPYKGDSYKKFVPFCKVDEARREVFGIVTAETPDKDGEVCKYDLTKPNYQQWSHEFVKATDGKSVGNLRRMHDAQSAVGKGILIEYHDEDKEIYMGFKVTDDQTWNDVMEGVLTGFSQGGKYGKVWRGEKDDLVYYEAIPAEVSVVDNPCLGVAHFALVRADSTIVMRKVRSVPVESIPAASTKVLQMPTPDPELAKAAAALSEPSSIDVAGDAFLKNLDEQIRGGKLGYFDVVTISRQYEAVFGPIRKAERLGKDKKTKRVGGEDLGPSAFAWVGDPADPASWKLPIHDAAHVRNALSRFNQTKGIPASEKEGVWEKILRAAKKFGIKVSEDSDKVALSVVRKIAALRGDIDLQKNMYDIGRFAELLEMLSWLLYGAINERMFEGDESPVPESLLENLNDLIETFRAMAEEESGELLAFMEEKAPMLNAMEGTLRRSIPLLEAGCIAKRGKTLASSGGAA
jgi:hypothetical protein